MGRESKEPAKSRSFHPSWDVALRAGEKSERSSNAMDARAVKKIVTQVGAEFFLRAAGGRDDDMFRPLLLNLQKQRVIFHRGARSNDMNSAASSSQLR